MYTQIVSFTLAYFTPRMLYSTVQLSATKHDNLLPPITLTCIRFAMQLKVLAKSVSVVSTFTLLNQQ